MSWASMCDSILSHVLTHVIPIVKSNKFEFCNACQLGKLHQFSFKSSALKTIAPFELINSELTTCDKLQD